MPIFAFSILFHAAKLTVLKKIWHLQRQIFFLLENLLFSYHYMIV